jgi:NitT/TauT family transport system substrate-binding protein
MTLSSPTLIRNIRAASAILILTALPALSAAQPKLTLGVPGVPAIFSDTIAFVADKQGFFKKHGVDVTVRQFETGAFASRAAVSGEIDAALPPTPLVVSQISNSDVPLVAIWGMENPDWLIGSTDPNATCDSLKGAPVGVDSVGGARSIALKVMLIGGCKMKIEDVQQVALGSSSGAAMIAGQLKYAVLHIDDVPVIEAETKKPLKTLVLQKTSRPVDHYLLIVARKDKLAANRDAYVRMLAGLIEAERFMRDPANAAKVALDAAPTGRSVDFATKSLKTYLDMEFWPHEKDGLSRTNIEAVTKGQQAVGNIKPDKTPASYERLVDPTVWRDAYALVNKR